jgi:AraC-like DNA-binding protein
MGRVVDQSAERIEHRVEGLMVAHGVGILRDQGTALRLVRGPKELQLAAPEATTFTVQLGARAVRRDGRSETAGNAGDLSIIDLTSYAEYEWWGEGGHESLTIDNRVLGLPVDVIRQASDQLVQNPLCGLLRSHMSRLLRPEFESTPTRARALVASACVELARAVVTTAVADPRARGTALQSALALRIEAFIDQHLSDNTLNAEQIALAHHISVRQLYNIWATNEQSVAEYIMTARLEGARREMAHTDPTHLSVSAIAMRWGFTDPAHFSRRFRTQYGLSPREWYAAQRALSTNMQ